MASKKIIAFDADDTLWANEPLFINTREKCESVLAPYIEPSLLEQKLYATEIKNLKLFGYGIKGFILSMIETGIQLSSGQISGNEIQQIIDMGKDMIAHPIELIPNVEYTLSQLNGKFELMVITKGDLFDQESKIARSGLADYFGRFEIVSEKTTATYQNILHKYDINPAQFVMVGNSLKSDILPVCNLGACAVHIPFHTTWEHEKVSPIQEKELNYHYLTNIALLPELLNQLKSQGSESGS